MVPSSARKSQAAPLQSGSSRHASAFDDRALAQEARELMQITGGCCRISLDDTIVF
jgi:hypothetical protein